SPTLSFKLFCFLSVFLSSLAYASLIILYLDGEPENYFQFCAVLVGRIFYYFYLFSFNTATTSLCSTFLYQFSQLFLEIKLGVENAVSNNTLLTIMQYQKDYKRFSGHCKTLYCFLSPLVFIHVCS